MAFHDGELETQARAGVEKEAAKLASFARQEISAGAALFLEGRTFVVTGTLDAEGNVTASILGGPAGFARAIDWDSVRIEPVSGHIARVRSDLAASPDIGLLAIDFATRRRIRVNGRAAVDGNGIVISTREVYSNCPQYIHVRPAPRVTIGEAAADLIGRADTFFIATAHPEAGADVSHRGGPAGFVRVESPTTLVWDDYAGNNMFNTLGNLARNPRAGLLFIDFDSGRTLQLHGSAHVRWGEPRSVAFEVSAPPAGTP